MAKKFFVITEGTTPIGIINSCCYHSIQEIQDQLDDSWVLENDIGVHEITEKYSLIDIVGEKAMANESGGVEKIAGKEGIYIDDISGMIY